MKYKTIILLIAFFICSCGKENADKTISSIDVEKTNESIQQKEVMTIPRRTEKKITKKPEKPKEPEKAKKAEIKVTFIELGHVKCIPCKMMQPIIKEIEEEYKGKVNVVFYDVKTEEGSPYAEKYRIRVIPTQVFLDENGVEFFRHEGFLPKDEIVKIFKDKGL